MDRLQGFTIIDDFAGVTDPAIFTPLGDDWLIGLTDVVSSTAAIEAGRYKAVNMAGAAAISALMNALGTRAFPFAFGGDGCAFALPPGDREAATNALARTAAWAAESLDLTLRAALCSVRQIRDAGYDVRVALFAPSPNVAYALFDGGGVAHAEAAMKAGSFAVPLDAATPPDLTGLSCRWLPLRPDDGAVLSLIARPGPAGDAAFRRAIDTLLSLITSANHPVPPDGPPPALISPGVGLEARAIGGTKPLWRRRLTTRLHTLLGWTLFRTHIRLGNFDPVHYRRVASINADARKFGDGLMLTLDATPAVEQAINEALHRAAAEGAVVFGLHRQDAALMTCIVPSYTSDDHFHFVDGADGGYARAAAQLHAGP